MKLFLASYIKHPSTMNSLNQFVGGLENNKVAYIPTAGNGEKWGSWKQESGSWGIVSKQARQIDTILLEDCTSEEFVKRVSNSDIVWFAGGMPGYLSYWIQRKEVDKNIKKLLDSGIIYVGSSAGSMVAGKSLEISEFDFVDKELGASRMIGMKLVDFDIFPHYRDEYYEKIGEMYKGDSIYLLKDGEQIIVDGDKVEVQGEERII